MFVSVLLDNLYQLFLALGVLCYTLWAVQVYPVRIQKTTLSVGMLIFSFTSLYLLNFIDEKPAVCVAAGAILVFLYILVLRLPSVFSVFSAVYLMFVYLFFLSVSAGVLSLLNGKNIYQIMLVPATSRVVYLLTGILFAACMLIQLRKANTLTIRAIGDSSFTLAYITTAQSLITGFMLYSSFDYYLNLDNIWLSVWHIVSSFIMMAFHIVCRVFASRVATILLENVRQEKDNELLENQQAYLASLKASKTAADDLYRRYHELIMTVSYLAEMKQTDEIQAYLQNADTEREATASAMSIHSNNGILNSLLFSVSSLCDSKAIDFTAFLYLPEELSATAKDIYSVMQELLKNAVNACDLIEQSQKYIKVETTASNNWLTITTTNTYRDAVNIRDDLPESNTKDQREYGGVGLQYVKRIVEQHDGLFLCEARNKERVFCVKLMLPY